MLSYHSASLSQALLILYALFDTILVDIGAIPLAVLLIASFCTSMIHGATGIAGGFLLAAVAAPILGVQAIVPVLSITLLISHGARAILNFKQFDQYAFLHIVFPALPFIVVAAFVYGRLSNQTIAFVLGSVVLLSIPLRRSAKKWKLTPSKPILWLSGGIYGSISGVAIGPGMLLMPILFSLGMKREAFVATLAAIALSTNLVRASVYGFADLLSPPIFLLGVLVGLATIPGTWIGRSILRSMSNEKHVVVVEWLVIVGGLNFFWMAYSHF